MRPAQSTRDLCLMILESEEATVGERAAAQLRLDELEAGSRGQLYIRLDAQDPSLPAGVTNMEKLESPEPTSILDRNALIAAIKKITPDFEAGDKSLDYLRGFYSHAAQPAGGEVFKNGDALNPGPHAAKLDATDLERTIATRLVQRNRSITAHCRTDEERAAVIARADYAEHSRALHVAERGQVASSRLDASDPSMPPVVRAQIRSIERGQARSRGAIDKSNGFGTDNGGNDDAA